MSDAEFPFLFHGPSPDDWFDEPVHAWIVRFAREPTPAERASLAAAWERASRDFARGLGADLRLPWWWSGAWALVPARVGDRSPDTMRALFEAKPHAGSARAATGLLAQAAARSTMKARARERARKTTRRCCSAPRVDLLCR